jgi:L-2-hydroxyglutarate oxidase
LGGLPNRMKSDFLIIGGGVIGLTIARELKRRHASATVALIEKEKDCGTHASGRNSGVLHAGFYYTADSLKARFTRDGNIRMTKYCEERGLKINKCGKLVVAQSESDLPWLDELLARAKKNGVELQDITDQQAKEIEPRVRTLQRALFSPVTSSVDPKEVINRMVQDAKNEGVQIHPETKYISAKDNVVETNKGNFEASYVVNAAGLYADKIANDYGFAENYRVLPFKGLYLYSSEPAGSLRTHIYPVPNLANPFLGVHFTLTAYGRTKLGPTAIPAFWREQYGPVENFNPHEIADIIMRQTKLMFSSSFDFRKLAWEEMRKYSRAHMIALAAPMLDHVNPDHYKEWGKPGIRAQLLDIKKQKLEMDFVLEGDDRSMHVLNAVSPAFTCALPFADYVCDAIDKNLRNDLKLRA